MHTKWNRDLILVYWEGNFSAQLMFPEHLNHFFYIHKSENPGEKGFWIIASDVTLFVLPDISTGKALLSLMPSYCALYVNQTGNNLVIFHHGFAHSFVYHWYCLPILLCLYVPSLA